MNGQQWVELIVTWLPLFVLLLAWIYFMRRANRHYKGHVAEVNAINAEILQVNRDMLTELRQIRKALEDRKS